MGEGRLDRATATEGAALTVEDTLTVCLVMAGAGAGLALLLWIDKRIEEIRERRRREREERARRALTHRRQYMPGSHKWVG